MPRTTWRRTIPSELEDIVFSMGQAQCIGKDRGRWRQIVDTLCPIGDEEEKYVIRQIPHQQHGTRIPTCLDCSYAPIIIQLYDIGRFLHYHVYICCIDIKDVL
jgi:hypothetical protein